MTEEAVASDRLDTYTDSATDELLQVLSITCVSAALAWQVLNGVELRKPTLSAFQIVTAPLYSTVFNLLLC